MDKVAIAKEIIKRADILAAEIKKGKDISITDFKGQLKFKAKSVSSIK